MSELTRLSIHDLTGIGEVRETVPTECVSCGHPKTSHEVFTRDGDHGCYHTMGCTCLEYSTGADVFTATPPYPLDPNDFTDGEEIPRDFSDLTRKLNLDKFFDLRDKAAGYSDYDHHDWAQVAHELGVTDEDEESRRQAKAADAGVDF